MMTNKEIARYINNLGKIMELHNENPFKVRSYYNAYNVLRKIEKPFSEMDENELSGIKGVGKAISSKICELVETGELKTYKKYADITPPGVVEMLGVRGVGPKKIRVIWKELAIETIGELLYACSENRLVDLKGFGSKTQTAIMKQLQYFVDSRGKYLYGFIEDEALDLVRVFQNKFPSERHEITGAMKEKDPIVETIEIITTTSEESIDNDILEELGLEKGIKGYLYKGYPVRIHFSSKERFIWEGFTSSASSEFLEIFNGKAGDYKDEKELFSAHGLPYITPELRHDPGILDKDIHGIMEHLIHPDDISGIIHSHTSYSDGIHTLEEMAAYAQDKGYKYLVNSDHSKAAFYANGLDEDRVFQQFEEIDRLNSLYSDFTIYKGIEADILSDGSMDYGDGFLQHFEVVIASVHSNLKMDAAKANHRLIRAIENPNTHILGHPTGRILLSREGYPIDHKKIIDACADNGMVIELNANPLRLDLDWTWIGYAMEKGVMISINPDSHSKEQMDFTRFGVYVARKAGLQRNLCLNAMEPSTFAKWVRGLK